MKPKKEITYYSPEVKGAVGNYNWSARYDYTDGFIGINQDGNDGLERVLLSPNQVRKLIAFINDPVAEEQ